MTSGIENTPQEHCEVLMVTVAGFEPAVLRCRGKLEGEMNHPLRAFATTKALPLGEHRQRQCTKNAEAAESLGGLRRVREVQPTLATGGEPSPPKRAAA